MIVGRVNKVLMGKLKDMHEKGNNDIIVKVLDKERWKKRRERKVCPQTLIQNEVVCKKRLKRVGVTESLDIKYEPLGH